MSFLGPSNSVRMFCAVYDVFGELTHGRAGEAARSAPAGSHTAVEASTIDCISWGLDYWSCGWKNDTFYRFW